MRYTSSHQARSFASQNGHATHVWRPAPPPIHQGLAAASDTKAKPARSVGAPSGADLPAR